MSLVFYNNHFHNIIDNFYETFYKFIVWICHKFEIGESKELIRNFEEEMPFSQYRKVLQTF